MKYSLRIGIAVSLLLFPLVYGCGSGKPPVEEPKLAQQAMDQAKEVQAEKLAGSDWGSAVSKLNDAQFAMKSKRYGDAKTFFLQAKSRFEKAYAVGKVKQDGYLKEVDEERTVIGTNMSKLKAMTAKAPAKVKKEAEGSCAEIEKKIADLDKAVSSRDAIQAKLTSKDVQEKIFQATRTLEMGGKR